MFVDEFQTGGPIMYACLAAWILVLAGVFDRVAYALGRAARRPRRAIEAALSKGQLDRAELDLGGERRRAERGLNRIDAISQIATSIGLFGTVVGIARSFLTRGTGELASTEALAAGLSTALFTTVAGLVVFLFGQGFLIAYGEWCSFCERGLDEALARAQATQRSAS